MLSIPFKREGAWEDQKIWDDGQSEIEVSIPFKREGAWKDIAAQFNEDYNLLIEFQFPSNGKAHGKDTMMHSLHSENFRFNSLQTGRRMER